MNMFLKKFIGFSIGPIGAAFISFITIPLTTYFIEPSEYGKASMFLLFQMMIGTFLYLGIDQSYTREYHSSNDRLNLFQNAILIPVILALFALIITVLFPNQISNVLFDSGNFILPAILFGIMIVFMVIERFILLSLRMEEKAFEYSLLNIFSKLSILIFTLLFLIFIRRDFLAVVYSTVFGQIIANSFLLIRYKRLFLFKKFSINKPLLKNMLLFGLPIVVATSLSSLLNSLDRLFLRTWSDFHQIGIYSATLKIAGVLTVVQLSFTNFWVPTAYRWHEEGKDIKYFKLVSDSILLIMSILFCGVLIFKELITYVLSSGYAESIYIFAFLCLQPIIYTVSETTCLGIVFSRKSYLSIWVGLIAIIPNIIINILLVPKYGAIGAAIATSVSYIFFFISRTYLSQKNGMKFPVVKHYVVILFLLSGAFLNLLTIKWMFLINVFFLLLIIGIQFNSIKRIWSIYKRKDIKELVFSKN